MNLIEICFNKFMRYYLAYKFRGADKDQLKEYLQKAERVIEAAGHKSYSYFGDEAGWEIIDKDPGEAIKKGFEELENSDVVLALITQQEKSTGMLLELGSAKAQEKEVIVAVAEEIDVPTLEAISDQHFAFSSIDNFQAKLRAIV